MPGGREVSLLKMDFSAAGSWAWGEGDRVKWSGQGWLFPWGDSSMVMEAQDSMQ